MHFSIFGTASTFGTAINSRAIVNAITMHGILVFHTTEMQPFLRQENLADIIAVYKQSERFYVVDIGIEELDRRVNPKIALEYLEKYRRTCEYFYLAGKKFSRSTLEMKDIGLFDLSRMKVIKNPEYLNPDMDFRANLMRRIRNNFCTLTNAEDDHFQKTITEF